MTRREQYEAQTESILQPIMEANNFELVDVEYVKEAGTWYLRAYIDKEGGIAIDDCELVSRALSEKLDELDLIFKDKEMERKFFIQFYVIKTKIKKITSQKEEVENIQWIDMEKVFEMIRNGETKFPYDKRYEKLFEKVREIYINSKKENMQEK